MGSLHIFLTFLSFCPLEFGITFILQANLILNWLVRRPKTPPAHREFSCCQEMFGKELNSYLIGVLCVMLTAERAAV